MKRLTFGAELIVDNFAGGGGASEGMELATGRPVDLAINHDPEAVAMHTANHPQTRHYCEDVFKVDPMVATGGRPVGLAWFSPDCKHFSKAKGGKPKAKKIRGLAWVMVKWAATVQPRVMILENVEEFQTWGPLLVDGSACPRRKGMTFRNFVARLRNLGYAVEWRELRACDYGAPTIRKRLILIARCDGRPVIWPEPTHGDPKSPAVQSGRLKPWRTAAECIDWNIPCPSIFERSKSLAEATMRRIARGIRKFVLDSPAPFIVKYHSAKRAGDDRVGSTEEPLHTQSTENRFAVAVPFVSPVTHPGDQRVHDLQEPFRTVTGAHRGEFALVSPVMVNTCNGKFDNAPSRSRSPEEPLPTITGDGKFAIAAATLVQTGYGEREGQAPRAPGLKKPLGTVVGGGQKHAAVAAFLAKHYGGNETPGASLANPADTITTVDHHALVTAHVQRDFGASVGHEPTEPMGTVTGGGGGKAAVVTSHLAKLYGTTTGQSVEEPMHTVTGGGNHIAEVRAFLIKYYGEGGQDQDLREPMHTIPTRDRIGLVTIAGEEYVITDIGMRMLAPHELFAAQGFPADYVIAPMVEDRQKSQQAGHKVLKRLPKHAQVRCCGNSVCPPLAEALAAANVPDLIARGWRRRAA